MTHTTLHLTENAHENHLITQYSEFVRMNYGEFAWDEILFTIVHGRLLSDLMLEYGIHAFQALVNATSKVTSTSVKNLMEAFVLYKSS